MTDFGAYEKLRAFYAGRRVLVTGHTGFKGSWLTLWLSRLGAEVYGLSLVPDQGEDAIYHKASVDQACVSTIGDIRDFGLVEKAFREARPSIVFHLAARALVQQGYDDPLATFATNVSGTANVLEASRHCESVCAFVCVTTDKVYLNREWPWPYREIDELGGLDPYAASKAAAELVVRAYRRTLAPKDRSYAIATARGGNVIGGGDWSPHRLVPDVVRSVRADSPLVLRNPDAKRPWQHVLDLCFAYLMLGQRLATDTSIVNEGAWNFGPPHTDDFTVSQLVDKFLHTWGRPDFPVERQAAEQYEAQTLRLDASLAHHRLGWRPLLDCAAAVSWTAAWYENYMSDPSSARAITETQITCFELALAEELTDEKR